MERNGHMVTLPITDYEKLIAELKKWQEAKDPMIVLGRARPYEYVVYVSDKVDDEAFLKLKEEYDYSEKKIISQREEMGRLNQEIGKLNMRLENMATKQQRSNWFKF